MIRTRQVPSLRSPPDLSHIPPVQHDPIPGVFKIKPPISLCVLKLSPMPTQPQPRTIGIRLPLPCVSQNRAPSPWFNTILAPHPWRLVSPSRLEIPITLWVPEPKPCPPSIQCNPGPLRLDSHYFACSSTELHPFNPTQT